MAVIFCYVAIKEAVSMQWGGDPFLLIFLVVGTYFFLLVTNLPPLFVISKLRLTKKIGLSLGTTVLLVLSITAILFPPLYVNYFWHPTYGAR
jgi:hypothetical protein